MHFIFSVGIRANKMKKDYPNIFEDYLLKTFKNQMELFIFAFE